LKRSLRSATQAARTAFQILQFIADHKSELKGKEPAEG
jgi:hypothetical protein